MSATIAGGVAHLMRPTGATISAAGHRREVARAILRPGSATRRDLDVLADADRRGTAIAVYLQSGREHVEAPRFTHNDNGTLALAGVPFVFLGLLALALGIWLGALVLVVGVVAIAADLRFTRDAAAEARLREDALLPPWLRSHFDEAVRAAGAQWARRTVVERRASSRTRRSSCSAPPASSRDLVTTISEIAKPRRRRRSQALDVRGVSRTVGRAGMR